MSQRHPHPGSSPMAKAEGFVSSAKLSSSFDSDEAGNQQPSFHNESKISAST